jgi:hypothetical protein
MAVPAAIASCGGETVGQYDGKETGVPVCAEGCGARVDDGDGGSAYDGQQMGIGVVAYDGGPHDGAVVDVVVDAGVSFPPDATDALMGGGPLVAPELPA